MTAPVDAGRTPPAGYRLVLPPGWVRIPLREGTSEALEEFLFSGLRELPAEVPKDQGMAYRLQVRRTVEERVRQAQEADGIDLYIPVHLGDLRYRIPLAASFLVSEFIAEESDPGPEVLLARLAGGSKNGADAEVRELADTLVVRRAYIRPPDSSSGPDSVADFSVATRCVDYALAVPYDDRRYFTVCFSTAGDGDPQSDFSDALVELFDALMTTFRWTGAP